MPRPVDWLLRVDAYPWAVHISAHQARQPTDTYVPVDLVDHHSGCLWRITPTVEEWKDGPNGLRIPVFTATPQPCSWTTSDLLPDRYDAALAMTRWDQYL